MSYKHFLGSILSVVALSACSNSDGPKAGAATVASLSSAKNPHLIVQKGSGKACPNLTGKYLCQPSQAEKQKGVAEAEKMSMSITKDAQGRSILTVDEEKRGIILDGNVHEVTEESVKLFYSVNCDNSKLSFHLSNQKEVWLRVEYLLEDKTGRLNVRFSGVQDNKVVYDEVVCHREQADI